MYRIKIKLDNQDNKEYQYVNGTPLQFKLSTDVKNATSFTLYQMMMMLEIFITPNVVIEKVQI